MVSGDSDWYEEAEQFYRGRARTLTTKRWLPEEFQEDFIRECIVLELADRRAASPADPDKAPDRFHITTRALSVLRRTSRSMPWSVRQRLEREGSTEPSSDPEPSDDDGKTGIDQLDDVQLIASWMDVVGAMHWMVWLTRKRSKPHGSGYTVRAIAGLVGVPRMRAAREIASLSDWFSRVWGQVCSGEVRSVRAEFARAAQAEAEHFATSAGVGPADRLGGAPLFDISQALSWLVRTGILQDDPSAQELIEKVLALGLVGETGRYLVTAERRIQSLGAGGLQDWMEDLSGLAACRQRGVSWNDLVGLQSIVSRHLQWISRLESQDLANPDSSVALHSIDVLEELLMVHPLGLQYWGNAFAQQRTGVGSRSRRKP